jgi:hypothetical protein
LCTAPMRTGVGRAIRQCRLSPSSCDFIEFLPAAAAFCSEFSLSFPFSLSWYGCLQYLGLGTRPTLVKVRLVSLRLSEYIDSRIRHSPILSVSALAELTRVERDWMSTIVLFFGASATVVQSDAVRWKTTLDCKIFGQNTIVDSVLN